MRLVQPLLTDEQAELVAAALRDAEEQLKYARVFRGDIEVTSEDVAENERLDEDIKAVGRLMLLFQDASENPAKYPPSPKMANTIHATFKGSVPQPKSRRNSRKTRQAERQRWRKFARAQRREFAEQYNEAVAIQEREQAEHDANVAAIAERIKDQTKFDITDGFGNTIIAGVPEEFIREVHILVGDQPDKFVVA